MVDVSIEVVGELFICGTTAAAARACCSARRDVGVPKSLQILDFRIYLIFVLQTKKIIHEKNVL